MVGEVRINYQPQSPPERQLLEEIIERTRATAQIEEVTVDIYVKTFERAETEENVLTFGEAEINYATRTGVVTIPAATRKILSPLAFKGLVYHMIGCVFGAYFFKLEDKEKQELFSEEKTPQREALFDFIMLHKGGTIEALIAYKVESVRKTMEMVKKHEEIGFNTGAFSTYCKQLDHLQENLGTTIYSLATQGIMGKSEGKKYEN